MRAAFARAGAARGVLGDGMYYNAHAHSNDGVSNASVQRSGQNVGRGIPAHGPAATREINDRPVPERSWTKQPAIGPQMQYGPPPREDRPIHGMKPEGEPWNGSDGWPVDSFGAYIPPAQLLGIDPKALQALLEAGKAAGTIAADVTAESMARRQAKLASEQARNHTRYQGKRAAAESASAQRAEAEAAREQARADAVVKSTKAKTTAWIILGVSAIGAITISTIVIFRNRKH